MKVIPMKKSLSWKSIQPRKAQIHMATTRNSTQILAQSTPIQPILVIKLPIPTKSHSNILRNSHLAINIHHSNPIIKLITTPTIRAFTQILTQALS